MKKKIVMISVLLTFGHLSASSQSLSQTTWALYEPSGEFYIYIHFSENLVSHSSNNITYFNNSTYHTSSDTFTILSLPNEPCPDDTGTYTFTIENDTLKFTLLSDNCENRPPTFLGDHWVRVLTAVQEVNLTSAQSLYPNPTNDLVNIPYDGMKTIIVTDMHGQCIKIVKADAETISLKELASGSYTISVLNSQYMLIATQQIIYSK